MTISVIVPVLDEAGELPAVLDHLRALVPPGPPVVEVLVVDGGSADDTVALARGHPLEPTVLETRPGRAVQMNAGARAASGSLLVFLHADTRLPHDAVARLATAADDPAVAGGNFDLAFDGTGAFSRVLEVWRRWERRLGVYYGDSVIFCEARAFRALGGYRPLPIMEDYDLARRLEQRFGTVCLPGPAVTSGRRWRRLGIPRTFFSWVVIRWLWLAGVPARRLARLYPDVR